MERSRVFISYRRADSAGDAGRLEEDLQRTLGPRVFRDVSDIAPGADFDATLRAELRSCGITLALIGRRWTEILHAQEARAVDYVRLELAEALTDDQVRVIPVLLDGAQLPSADELPENLRALVRRQARSLRNDRWQSDVDDLAAELRALLGVGRVRAVLARAPWLLPMLLTAAFALAVAGWRGHSESVARPPDPASRLPFDRAAAHELTIAATRHAVDECRTVAGASGECPVLFELLADGTVRDAYYPVGYCDFKGSPFGDCVLHRLAALHTPGFSDVESAQVQLDINVSPGEVRVEVDE